MKSKLDGETMSLIIATMDALANKFDGIPGYQYKAPVIRELITMFENMEEMDITAAFL